MPALDILTIPVGQLATQCYLVSLPDRDDCIVIDPGAEPERIRAVLQKKRLAAILLTHGHFDHIGAVSALMDADTPLYIHALDAPMLTDPKLNLCRMIGQTITAPPANRLLQEGWAADARTSPAAARRTCGGRWHGWRRWLGNAPFIRGIDHNAKDEQIWNKSIKRSIFCAPWLRSCGT